MKATESDTEVLDLLAEHERAAGRLYMVYSEMFIEHQGFWLGLSAEEMMHAAKIEELARTVNPDDLDVRRFNPRAVSTSLEYVTARVREAQTRDLDMVTALSVALDLERAIIERKWFEAFRARSAEAREVLASIVADTRRHAEMVTAMWETTRRRRGTL
jgi:rubrerythrin